MPAYCEIEDVTTVGVNVVALKKTPTEEITKAILFASGKIDSYIGAPVGPFNLPLTVWGGDIKRCASIIAAYDVISGRGYNPNDSESDVLRERYLDEIRWLEHIAARKAMPVGVTDTPVAGGGPVIGQPRVRSNASRGWQSTDSNSGGAFTGRRR